MNTEEYNFDDIEPVIEETPDELKDVVLCKIMYTPEFITTFSYLKALMLKGEKSKRAMYVATSAIALVPAHYTVWNYKFEIVKELATNGEYDLNDELKWCDEIALNNEKNYQIWHYRETIIELLIELKFNNDKTKYDLNKEYEIVHEMLDSDEKNYHVWSHKRWAVVYFGLFKNAKELEYTKFLIDRDVRNNSAWNFRHFVNFGTDNDEVEDNNNVLNEIEFTKGYIELSFTNPSSWNYMKFLYSLCKKLELQQGITEIKQLVEKYSVLDLKEGDDVEKVLENRRISIPAFELLCDIYKDEGKVEQMKGVYTLLGETLDPVRRNYWEYRMSLVV